MSGRSSQLAAELFRDLRIALRTLGRSRVFTGFAVITLALAIAASTAAYSIVDALVFPHVPFRDSERLVEAHFVMPHGHFKMASNAYEQIHEGGRTFEPTASRGRNVHAVLVDHGTAINVTSVLVSRNYFDLLRVSPWHGRLFAAADPEDDAAIVVSERLWRRLAGDDEPFAPRTVALDERTFTIAGVLPHNGALPSDADVFVPYAQPTYCCGSALIRLRAGVRLPEATQELNLRARQIDEEQLGYSFQVQPAVRTRDADLALPAAIVAACTGLFLIACANVASLLLARGRARGRDIAIRLALGSSRPTLVRFLMGESVILALLGGTLGIALAILGVRALAASLPPELALLGAIEPQLSWRAIGIAALLATLAALVCGLAPALLLARTDISQLLRRQSGTATSHRRRRPQWLIAAEIAGAMGLVMLAVLSGAAARHVRHLDLGYDPRNLIVGFLEPTSGGAPAADPPDASRAVPDVREFASRLDANGGVAAASALWSGSHGAGFAHLVTTENAEGGQGSRFVGPMIVRIVTPNLTSTLGVTVLRGRPISGTLPDGLAEVLLDERAAAILWPRGDPVGRLLRLGKASTDSLSSPWMRVVGIVRTPTLNLGSCWDGPCEFATVLVGAVGAPPPGSEIQLVVRAGERPADAAVALRQSLATAFPRELTYVRSWDEAIGLRALRAAHDFVALLFGLIALLALLLVVLGVHGVASHAAERRRREYGIRLALGASRQHVIRLVLYDGLLTSLVGLLIGLPVTYRTTRALEWFLYGIDSQTPLWLGAGLLLLFAATVTAGLGPALKVARGDPAEVLRAE